jgi:hypothetical protein
MNMSKVHVPERLEGESQAEYNDRRRMSQRLARRGRLLAGPKERYAAPAQRRTRRNLVKAIGLRQLKRLTRARVFAKAGTANAVYARIAARSEGGAA